MSKHFCLFLMIFKEIHIKRKHLLYKNMTFSVSANQKLNEERLKAELTKSHINFFIE